jgi:Fe-S cluster assembly protein SufD
MPPIATPLREKFLIEISARQSNGHPGWFDAVRKQAAAAFAELDFPTQRTEDWRFTSVKPILATAFETAQSADAGKSRDLIKPFLFGESGWSELVFVDGRFEPALSNVTHSRITIGSLHDALSSGDAAIESHLGRLFEKSPSAFNALNTALATDGAFINVPKNTQVNSVIHLVYVTTDHSKPVATHPRSLIIVGDSSEVTLVETYASLSASASAFCNGSVEVFLGPNAKATRYKLIHEADNAFNLTSTRVRLDRNATFDSFVFTMSGKIVRDDLKAILDGEGASCNLYGLYMTAGSQLVDNATAIEHVKPNCSSWIGYKGVLDDTSHGVFSGKIYVHREAQKTDSKQLNQNLLLSDKATINTKPLLEIFADDVKCTHGATIGQHPDEIIFYFRSRGMSEAMARGMLTYGFAGEVVDRVELGPLRKRLDRHVFDRYSPIE